MTAETLPRFEICPLSYGEGRWYLIEFPDHPSCIGNGETPEEAMTAGRNGLTAYLRALEDLRPSMPNPRQRIPDRQVWGLMAGEIFSVFVSSTYEDLRGERAEVQKALLKPARRA